MPFFSTNDHWPFSLRNRSFSNPGLAQSKLSVIGVRSSSVVSLSCWLSSISSEECAVLVFLEKFGQKSVLQIVSVLKIRC